MPTSVPNAVLIFVSLSKSEGTINILSLYSFSCLHESSIRFSCINIGVVQLMTSSICNSLNSSFFCDGSLSCSCCLIQRIDCFSKSIRTGLVHLCCNCSLESSQNFCIHWCTLVNCLSISQCLFVSLNNTRDVEITRTSQSEWTCNEPRLLQSVSTLDTKSNHRTVSTNLEVECVLVITLRKYCRSLTDTISISCHILIERNGSKRSYRSTKVTCYQLSI